MAISVKLGSKFCSKRMEASVLKLILRAVWLISLALKLADSKTTVLVVLLISASFPPLIPAIANGFLASAIIKILSSKL